VTVHQLAWLRLLSGPSLQPSGTPNLAVDLVMGGEGGVTPLRWLGGDIDPSPGMGPRE
jgi:hypothetical protein